VITIREVRGEDILHVADHLSIADQLEVDTVATNNPTPLSTFDAIKWGVNASEEAFAVCPILDGQEAAAVALFGLVPDTERSPQMAVVWMVTCDMLMTTSRDILRQAPEWTQDWLKKYPMGLHNLVDSRNTRHIKWLKKMGADFPGVGRHIRDIPFLYFLIAPRPQ
jgi:hypothetical protein